MNDYSDEDVGNIIALEHINVQVPDQLLATLFTSWDLVSPGIPI